MAHCRFLYRVLSIDVKPMNAHSFSAITFDRDNLENTVDVFSSTTIRSGYMQHDLFRSGHDLDLWSDFQHDLLSSNYNSFVAS